MSRKNSINTWIETGYEQFAAEGLEGIQVERLARITGLNKSGFYHYFGDRDNFLEHLMKRHLVNGGLIAKDMRQMKQFDPDFFLILLNYPLPVIVHMQLVRNRHHKLLNNVFDEINGIVDPAVVPQWANFLDIPDNHPLAHRYFAQVRDMFYSRITLKTMNYDFLRGLLYEAKDLMKEVIAQNSSIILS